MALPLALHRAGLTPKIAPGLLGGRLLLSAMGPLTPWLACALAALAREADRATRRLSDLTAQHRAWYRLLAGEGRRGHSRAPAVLDLLAVIPVLSASLVARHLNCTPQGASLILKSLVRTGVLTRATSRARWQIFLAADLTVAENKGDAGIAPLMPSAVIREIDRDALDLARL